MPAGEQPERATVLLGSDDGKLHLGRIEFQGADLSEPPVTSLASVPAVKETRIRSVRLSSDRAVVGSGTEVTVWGIDTAQAVLTPLERMSIHNVRAVQLVDENRTFVVMADRIIRRSICATSVVKAGTVPVKHVTCDEVGNTFAALEDGVILAIRGGEAKSMPGAVRPVTSLAVGHDGKHLLAGLDNGVLRQWTPIETNPTPTDSTPTSNWATLIRCTSTCLTLQGSQPKPLRLVASPFCPASVCPPMMMRSRLSCRP
jgi:hypothetical protein